MRSLRIIIVCSLLALFFCVQFSKASTGLRVNDLSSPVEID